VTPVGDTVVLILEFSLVGFRRIETLLTVALMDDGYKSYCRILRPRSQTIGHLFAGGAGYREGGGSCKSPLLEYFHGGTTAGQHAEHCEVCRPGCQ